MIIAPFSNGELVAFIFDTGKPVWSENVSKISKVSNFDIKDISASPVISGNTIYSLSSNGKLISVSAINGQRNWEIDLSGYTLSLPLDSQSVSYTSILSVPSDELLSLTLNDSFSIPL